MQNVSNAMLISALFLPGLWLGLLLRPRHLPWAVPIAVVVAVAYCWVRFHKESVEFWLLMAMVPPKRQNTAVLSITSVEKVSH
jgi:hypothetical protein